MSIDGLLDEENCLPETPCDAEPWDAVDCPSSSAVLCSRPSRLSLAWMVSDCLDEHIFWRHQAEMNSCNLKFHRWLRSDS
jgi:hypothetical protein